jgi:hypothetical protein
MSKRAMLMALLVVLVVSAAWAERVDVRALDSDVQVTVLESNENHTVVRFEIGAYERSTVNINGDNFFQISCGEEGVLLNAGEPALPHVCRSIIIPDDARMEARVVDSKYRDFAETPVAPSKGNLLRTVNPADVPYEFGPVYQGSSWYPQQLVALRDPYILRDYRGQVIDLHPFQYNPASKTLRVYTSVTVEIQNVGPGTINVFGERGSSIHLVEDFDQIYRSRFINYPAAGQRYESVSEIGDMLIISYDGFATAMQPLVDWKLQKGIKTTMVNVSQAGATATQIKSFIQSFYDSTDMAFVLLVGDAAQVPTMSASGGSSDPSYVKLAGGDDYPDAFIGRFSAESVADVQTQVERTITYERDATGSGWYHKGTGVASNLGPGHNGGEYDNEHMGKIRDSLLTFTYTEVDEIYDPTGTAAQVSAALNAGRSIVNYTGHGSTTDWGSTGFSNTDVNNLVNDNMLPFIVSVACLNGQFASYTCFGEAWLRATHNNVPTGAIGAYMSSINQSWNPPMDCQDEVVHLLIHRTKTSYGGLCFNGSCKMIDINGADGIELYNTWHIFGDPSVQVRTDDPQQMSVSHDGAVFFQSPTYSVNVVGVEGALCALYYDGTLYGSAFTDVVGNATIDIQGPLPIGAVLTLTVTAFNKQTYADDVQVTSDLAIVHTPLEDTRDTLNPYTVLCQIYTNSPLIADSLKLWYRVNSVWTSVQLRDTLAEEDYVAEIAPQSPGTVIDYYLFAANTEGYLDTTDTFTFRVIDYAAELTPAYAVQTTPSGDTAWYDFTVSNRGALSDDYSLAVTSNWPASVWDESGTTEITNTGSLVTDEDFNFKVAVLVPESAVYGESDSASLVTVSAGNPLISAEAGIVTHSAGTPLPLPFVESFPSTVLDTVKWDTNEDVAINDMAINEPSAPYSADFNGDPDGGDMLVSQAIDLGGETGVNISYYVEQTGGGESADEGDDLFVEYLNDQGQWVLLYRHLGVDPDMTTFQAFSFGVPADGYHSLFQLRFRNTASTGPYDDWFVDDIRIDYGPSISVTPASLSANLAVGDSLDRILTIANGGPGGLTYSVSVAPDFSRVPAFARLYDLGQVNPPSYDQQDGWQPIELAKGMSDPSRGPEVRYSAGGPDAFGYIWIDSDEPGGPTLDWVDILASGTDVTSQLDDDNFIGPFPIGFDFPYYDDSYNEFYIGANGLIGFGPTDGYGSLSNVQLPNTGTPNNAIYWCWDDLNVFDGDSTVQVLYETVGDALVIEFYHYPEYDYNVGDLITAEVVLFSDGTISLQYQEIQPGFTTNESTIGIENATGTDGLQIAYNTSYLHDGLAIQIVKPAQWLFLSQYSGELAPGESDPITVRFSAVETDSGVYNANIMIASNDPDPEDNPTIVPAEMTVGSGSPPAPPEIPALQTPLDSAIIDGGTPLFSWSATAGEGGTYSLQHSQDASFTDGVTTVPDLSDTSYTPSSDLADGVWFWHVEAVNDAGSSGYQQRAFCLMIRTYVSGDANGDDMVNVSDAVDLIAYIFAADTPPDPMESGDCNCDELVNISDVTYLIGYIFGGGPGPCEHGW